MEKELGVPLFIRTTRKVELTEFGLSLLPYAQSIIKLQFDYSARLHQLKNQQKGLVSIGSLPAMAQYHITDILLEFQRIYPENKISIVEDDPKVLLELLFNKSLELIFLREAAVLSDPAPKEPAALERLPYMTDYMTAVLPNGHPLASRKELTLRDLKDEGFAFIKENSLMHDLCCSACQEAGFVPDIVFSSHRLDSILDMVTKGGCTALLMNCHVEFPLNSAFSIDPPFTVIPVTPAVRTNISLCWQKEVLLSPAARRFIEFFKNRPRPL